MDIYFGGHSSVAVFDEKGAILMDPVFSSRIKVLKRRVDSGIPSYVIERAKVLLISHTHYDHLDIPTLKKLPKDVKAFCPWGAGKILKKAGLNNITEMRWDEGINVDGEEVVFLRSAHWSFRFTDWKSGWGSFYFTKDGVSFYFAGDSAYHSHFSEIGRRFKIDVAFLPVGAYRPSFIMKRYHMNPLEALRAFQDLNAKYMIPIHWGAYRIAMEGIEEPIEVLKKYITHIYNGSVVIMKPGERWRVPGT